MAGLFQGLGSIAFILIIMAVGMFIIKKRYPQIRKYHPYIGGAGIIFATLHGSGMIYYYINIKDQIFFILGIISLIILWLIGGAAVGMKKVPPKMKGKFFKAHKYLGMSVFIFIILHVILAQ